VMDDVLRRLLAYNGFQVTHVQNVTDVGHMTSDGDSGEDKMEKGARMAGKTVWEIADYYMKDFYTSMDLLNILRPTVICRATEHIKEQAELVKKLVDKGFGYETPEAIYFDVTKFPRYDGLFGQTLSEKQVAVREEVKTGEHKKHPQDFALWFKATGRFANHVMLWDSPWGKGFPGWHIECAAMSMKYLGETFDIHTGGEDHLAVHHPNEIAQAEAATGKPMAKYWVHTMFLKVDGQKMSKSLGNMYRVEDVTEKGFSPMALRYLYLTGHYRTPINFTWSSLTAAQNAYDKLSRFVRDTRSKIGDSRKELSREKLKKLEDYRARFESCVNEDMGLPGGLGVIWEMLKSNLPDYDKMDQLLDWDQILGLKLSDVQEEEAPADVKEMAVRRESLRKAGKFVEADSWRGKIEAKGWTVEDSKLGPKLKKVQMTNIR
jgi:cysteinyl-tRNA synthetase